MTTANVNITKVLLKRGNTTQNDNYTGVNGEITVDTQLKTLRIHDGVTVGGNAITASGAIGSYSNTNTAAYLSSQSITSANIGAFQTYANANAATQSTAINSLNANISSYQTYANANATTQTTEINSLRANITAANTAITALQSNAAVQAAVLDTLTGNAATQSQVLDTLTANAAAQATSLTTLLNNAVAQQTSLIDLVANAAVQAQAIANVSGTYSNANVKSYLSAFDGNILPSANVTYSLGDATHQWKDLWVSNNTIYIGNTPVRVDGGTLLVNGAPVSGVATYSNTNVEAYIGGNIGAYQTFANSNAATQATSINSINANIGSFYTYANLNYGTSSYANANVAGYLASQNITSANIGGSQTYANTQVNTINANLGAYQTFANSNAATQATSINTINANLGAYQTYGNLTFSTVANATSQAADITTLYANAATQSTAITTLQTQVYANTNVNTYLSSSVIGSLSTSGNLTVGGNLIVTGNSTVINTESYVVSDNIIQMANANPADLLDLGFVAHRTVGGTLQHTGLIRDASSDAWRLFSNVTAQPGNTVDFTNVVYDSLQVGGLGASYVTLSGPINFTASPPAYSTPGIQWNSGWQGDIYGNTQVATYLSTYSGNIAANISKNGYTWTFGTDGALILPALSGQIGRSGYTNGIDLYNNNGGTGYVRMNYADESFIWVDSGGAHVQTNATNTWDFSTGGNLTLPETGYLRVGSGIVAGFASSPAPFISGFSSISAENFRFQGNGVNILSTVTATANTGNITFSDTTIGTAGGASQGIILNSAGSGEIAMLDYVGINNTNPGYWLHVGDGSVGAVNNTGNISIDYNNGLDSSRGSTILGYAWWDAGSNGNNNRGIGAHRQFGIYKNDDLYTTKYIEFDLTSGNANLTNIAVTRVTTTNGVYWANGVSILSGISGTYGNTEVAAYLTGNITVGNINATQYNFANGVNILSTVGAGIYANADAAAYLAANTALYFGNPVTRPLLQANNTQVFVGNTTVIAQGGASSLGSTFIMNNAYYNTAGVLTARNTSASGSGQMEIAGGTFNWNAASSATAGSAAGMGARMSLSASGLATQNSIGITSAGTLTVQGASGLVTTQSTGALFNTTATTINLGGAATTINMGASTVAVSVGSGTGTVTTGSLNATNVYTSNAVIAGGYISGTANIAITSAGNISGVGNIIGATSNTTITAGAYVTSFLSNGMVAIGGNLTVSGNNNNVVTKASFIGATGTATTLDNISANWNGGPAQFQIATVSGSILAHWNTQTSFNGTFTVSSNNGTLTTSPTNAGGTAATAGDAITVLLTDITNGRFYRITGHIGPSYLNSPVIIERVV